MARDLAQLTADGESVETIREALDHLGDLAAPTSEWSIKIRNLQLELQAELQLLESEGRLL